MLAFGAVVRTCSTPPQGRDLPNPHTRSRIVVSQHLLSCRYGTNASIAIGRQQSTIHSDAGLIQQRTARCAEHAMSAATFRCRVSTPLPTGVRGRGGVSRRGQRECTPEPRLSARVSRPQRYAASNALRVAAPNNRRCRRSAPARQPAHCCGGAGVASNHRLAVTCHRHPTSRWRGQSLVSHHHPRR